MTSKVEQGRVGKGPIGRTGDFMTAPELSPILAMTMVRQATEIDAFLGHPSRFTFVEIGGGTGAFAKAFLRHCQDCVPALFERLSYCLIERSPYLKDCQAQAVGEVMKSFPSPKVTWAESIEQVPEESIVGMVFSNELVDALPVHRVRKENNQLKEIFVDYVDGNFIERLEPFSNPALTQYIQQHEVSVQEAQTTELHVASQDWMGHVAKVLQRGMVITIDYGHTTQDYYSPERRDGTFLCYVNHTISTNPYVRVGEQDMTAHVNFSTLATAGRVHGLMPVGLTTMTNWLMGLGVEELVAGKDEQSEEVKALMQLLRPQGMGKTFKVLVQRKGLEVDRLQGLRYPAFFQDVV